MYALPFFTVATLCTNQRISYLASIRVALIEKAILKNSTLLVQLNDAFCKTHPWLAQKVCTRSAHAAVSKVCADAVLKKVLNVWPSTIWPMRIAVLITTAEAFDNILLQERAYYYACVYTSDWNGSQTSILVVQCNWHHF